MLVLIRFPNPMEVWWCLVHQLARLPTRTRIKKNCLVGQLLAL
uniref:Uncharacterized protein n=1 Tax=Rhizophora mucronata TaxID=61149 RepID=A0A2P2IU73_RHIMU